VKSNHSAQTGLAPAVETAEPFAWLIDWISLILIAAAGDTAGVQVAAALAGAATLAAGTAAAVTV
jgi:hypothetical protein